MHYRLLISKSKCGGITRVASKITKNQDRCQKISSNADSGQSPESLLIPFISSKTVTGQIVLTKDVDGSLTMKLDGIRISAVSSRGESFSTLTDTLGQFILNLPAGANIVNVNQNALDEQFKLIKSAKVANLEQNENLHLQIEIRQKRRLINIQKQ